jgi:AbrB family looped-hinge helix DNA binding protein
MQMANENIVIVSVPVDENAQVTIPPEIRERMHLIPNDILLFSLSKEGECYVKKVSKMTHLYVKLKKIALKL